MWVPSEWWILNHHYLTLYFIQLLTSPGILGLCVFVKWLPKPWYVHFSFSLYGVREVVFSFMEQLFIYPSVHRFFFSHISPYLAQLCSEVLTSKFTIDNRGIADLPDLGWGYLKWTPLLVSFDVWCEISVQCQSRHNTTFFIVSRKRFNSFLNLIIGL